MMERPIIFSTPMVQALLAGRKSQTRRMIKNVFPECVRSARHEHVGGAYWFFDRADKPLQLLPCPYGKPGDRLWVKETHGYGGDARTPALFYRATDSETSIRGNWKSSLFMKREDSRILLEIISVYASRLQNINEADAKAEGLFQDQAGRLTTWSASQEAKEFLNPIDAYRDLWESINGSGSWNINPWVWVIKFEMISHNHSTPVR